MRRLEKTLQENPAFHPWAHCRCCWMLLPATLPCWRGMGTEHVCVHQRSPCLSFLCKTQFWYGLYSSESQGPW